MLPNSIALPNGYSTFSHQVAGHRFVEGKQGMLVDDDGKLLKPFQSPPRGERELKFYENVFENKSLEPAILKIRSFVPTFYGVKHCVFPGLSMKTDYYLALEDLTAHFNNPCVVDLKLGKIPTDPEKIEAKREKFKHEYFQQKLFGFRILGMELYNKSCNHSKFYDKNFGKNFKTQEDILRGLAFFFRKEQYGQGHIEETLARLKEIRAWMLEHHLLILYSSSVLVIYEGNVNSNCLLKENGASVDDEMINMDSLDSSGKCQCDSNSTKTESCTDALGLKNLVGANSEDINESPTENKQVNLYTSNGSPAKATLCTETSQNEYCGCIGKNSSEYVNNNSETTTMPHTPKVVVRLVDFAHSYFGSYDGPDENYLYGLNKLIYCLEQLV